MNAVATVPTTAQVIERYEKAIPAAFKAVTADHQASRASRFGISLSKVGGCMREAAFRMALYIPSNPELDEGESRMAHFGTWIHEGLLPYLAEELGKAQHEVSVVLEAGGLDFGGRMDLWDSGVATELKTVHSSKWGKIKGEGGPTGQHRTQLRAYALAMAQKGTPVHHLMWIYLSRDTGEHLIFAEAWEPIDSLPVVERLLDIIDHAGDPAAAPPLTVEGHLPVKAVCASCAWLTACKGEEGTAAMLAPWEPLAYDDPDIEGDLGTYKELGKKVEELEAHRKVLKAKFTTTTPATYGGLSWSRNKGGDTYDSAAARIRLTELRKRANALLDEGLDVPPMVLQLVQIAAAEEPQHWTMGSVQVDYVKTPA